jgi:hypothetical protein
MTASKYQQVAKAAGQAFSIAASVVGFLFDIVASFLKIPQVFQGLKWALSGVAGLIAGCVSGRNRLHRIEANEARERAQTQQQANDVKPSTTAILSVIDSLKQAAPDLNVLKELKEDERKAIIQLLSSPRNDRFFAEKDEKLVLSPKKSAGDAKPSIRMTM